MQTNRLLAAWLVLITLAVVAGAAVAGAPGQDKVAEQAAQTASRVTLAKGARKKMSGVIIRREADLFTLRDKSNGEVTVRLVNSTRVLEKKSNIFRSAKIYGATSLVQGLTVEIEGRGNEQGELVAEKIRFSDNALVAVQAAETLVNPVEGRVDTAEKRLEESEANAKRLADQLIEIDSISKKATSSARTAQETAEAAVAGVETTNRRIDTLVTDLDEYVSKREISINFRVGSASLLPEALLLLDEVARQAKSEKAYMVEITGFASAEGAAEKNRRLSRDRAEAVVRYLAESHDIPLRRIITPYGYGAARPIADNTTREGREQNRRVEVRILINKGLVTPPAARTTR